MLDIVFENRNKDYGAYYLRKRYVRYLLVSFSIILFLILLFVAYAWAYKFYSFKPTMIPRGVVYEPTYISEEEIHAPELPEEKLEEPVPEELEETPIVADSVQNTAQKEVEEKKETEKDAEKNDSSSGSSGPQGMANGDIMVPVQRMPQFPGGDEALAAFVQKNYRPNAIPRNRRASGIVVISFKVQRTGQVADIKVFHSINQEIDQECMRVVAMMPLWNPAISGGRPVEVVHQLPFVFP